MSNGGRPNIAVLDAKLALLQSDVSELKASYRVDMNELKTSLSTLSTVLVTLTSLEKQHVDTRDALKRAFSEIEIGKEKQHLFEAKVMERWQIKDQQLHDIERSIPEELPKTLAAHDKRVKDIELVMPGLLEMRKYLVSAVVIMVGMVFMALLAIVVKTPSVFGTGSTVFVPSESQSVAKQVPGPPHDISQSRP